MAEQDLLQRRRIALKLRRTGDELFPTGFCHHLCSRNLFPQSGKSSEVLLVRERLVSLAVVKSIHNCWAGLKADRISVRDRE